MSIQWTEASTDTVNELAECSMEHLDAEEHAMEEYDYPDLENHWRENGSRIETP